MGRAAAAHLTGYSTRGGQVHKAPGVAGAPCGSRGGAFLCPAPVMELLGMEAEAPRSAARLPSCIRDSAAREDRHDGETSRPLQADRPR